MNKSISQSVINAVFSREKSTAVTAYTGFVTKPQLLEKLFARNQLHVTKVDSILTTHGLRFSRKELQCCRHYWKTKYKISDVTNGILPMLNEGRRQFCRLG